jgi:ACR3 family arsenite transporter
MGMEMSKGRAELGFFEKYLAIWVATCMAAGLILSQYLPSLSLAINNWQVRGISIPIGICLFLMMYPALLNLQLRELKKLASNPKPIAITLFSNWIIAPIITVILANLFLSGHIQLIVSIILLGSSPCTAMVLVWGALADGNQEQNFITTSLNTVTIIFLYAPIVSLLTGVQQIPIDRVMLLISVGVFIGLPIILGYLSKNYLTRLKGETWFNGVYRPVVGRVSMIALLTTLVVLFSLNGDVLLKHPDLMVLISAPLLVGFLLIVTINLLLTKFTGLQYKEGIITVLIGSSSHFEIAIATAVSLYGLGSQAALGTTMGLFWEVPIMLGLVYLGKQLNTRGFWKK